MQKPTYVDALNAIHPKVIFSTIGDPNDYNALVWAGGENMPSQATLNADIITTAQQQMWEEIKDDRDDRTNNGGYRVGNYYFHSDQQSKTQQIALVILGANMPPGLMWKTMNGVFVPMTPVLAQQIFGAAVQADQTIFGTAIAHQQRMMASATPWSYEHNTLWPKTYDEAKAAGLTT